MSDVWARLQQQDSEDEMEILRAFSRAEAAVIQPFAPFRGKSFRLLDDVPGIAWVLGGDVEGSGCPGRTSSRSEKHPPLI